MPLVSSVSFRHRAHPLAGATVLQIIPDLEVNPAARTAIDVGAALAAAGARALVASAGGPLKSELQAKGGIFVPFPTQSKNPIAMTLNMRRLARLIAKEQAHTCWHAVTWCSRIRTLQRAFSQRAIPRQRKKSVSFIKGLIAIFSRLAP
jgi:hypothetical protein